MLMVNLSFASVLRPRAWVVSRATTVNRSPWPTGFDGPAGRPGVASPAKALTRLPRNSPESYGVGSRYQPAPLPSFPVWIVMLAAWGLPRPSTFWPGNAVAPRPVLLAMLMLRFSVFVPSE